jgi:hypothetical protein
MGDSGDKQVPLDLDSVADDPAARFAAQVERPLFRVRSMFVLGLTATIAFAAAVIWGSSLRSLVDQGRPATPVSVGFGGCTALDVNATIESPSMTHIDRAICLAVAGELVRARGHLQVMSEADRWEATDRLYARAQPLAERGQSSAEAIIALVTELSDQTNANLFHSGIVEFVIARDDKARMFLEQYLASRPRNPVRCARAHKALADIAAHVPREQRRRETSLFE